jgi:repressor LexA
MTIKGNGSVGINQTSPDANYKLTGIFTMKGVSKEITLDAEFGGINTDPWGNVKAGFPTGAEEDLNFMSLDEYLVDKPNSSFMLRVAGDSLEGIGIYKGDIVILEKAKDANRGEIVLALIDGEWTLKIIERLEGKTVLRSANPKYPDFYPHLSLEIFGIVRSVIRKYQ